MGASVNRQIRPFFPFTCTYCLGVFRPKRRHADTCSSACKQAKHEALTTEFVLGPYARRDSWSTERERATGWGGMTAAESYDADLRVRYEAGVDDGLEVEFCPGGDPDRWWKVRWWLDARGTRGAA
jgi:hypothetical protein